MTEGGKRECVRNCSLYRDCVEYTQISLSLMLFMQHQSLFTPLIVSIQPQQAHPRILPHHYTLKQTHHNLNHFSAPSPRKNISLNLSASQRTRVHLAPFPSKHLSPDRYVSTTKRHLHNQTTKSKLGLYFRTENR